jgi:hypothetical protein
MKRFWNDIVLEGAPFFGLLFGTIGACGIMVILDIIWGLWRFEGLL